MNTLFKLKPEAKQFFPKFKEKVEPLEFWDENEIHGNLLEVSPFCEAKVGVKISNFESKNSSWSVKNGAEFYFTLIVPTITYKNYNNTDRDSLVEHLSKSADEFFTK